MRPLSLQLLVLAAASWCASAAFIAKKPRWSTYTLIGGSSTAGLPPLNDIAGYNVVILSFLLTTGPIAKAQEFVSFNATQRAKIISDYHARGISIIVAAFGDSESPTGAGKDPVQVAKTMADFVKRYNLDGIDIDYEDFDAMNSETGSAENWIIKYHNALRAELPLGQYIISHAPVAPWFTTNTTIYPFGAYRAVHKAVGNTIDWYNVQFYNQEALYTTCEDLLFKVDGKFLHSSVMEIHEQTQVPLDKIVITKPAGPGDAAGGFIAPAPLAKCLKAVKALGWDAGVTFWQYPRGNARLLKGVTRGTWNTGTQCEVKSEL